MMHHSCYYVLVIFLIVSQKLVALVKVMRFFFLFGVHADKCGDHDLGGFQTHHTSSYIVTPVLVLIPSGQGYILFDDFMPSISVFVKVRAVSFLSLLITIIFLPIDFFMRV